MGTGTAIATLLLRPSGEVCDAAAVR